MQSDMLKKNKQMHPQIVWTIMLRQIKNLIHQELKMSKEIFMNYNYKRVAKGYLKLNKTIIDLNTFDNLINKTGLIKFSNSCYKKNWIAASMDNPSPQI